MAGVLVGIFFCFWTITKAEFIKRYMSEDEPRGLEKEQ
jgi:hypothetical protein